MMTFRETSDQVVLRLSRRQDVGAILPLACATVPGFVEHLWMQLAESGETAMEFGRRAQMAFVDAGNTMVAEVDGTVVGILISYAMAEAPNPHVPGMCDMLLPLMRLFQRVGGSWYLHGLATEPSHAGRGIGGKLMALAEDQARAAGKPRISLLVIDTNRHAIAYYEKRGFETTAREPVVRMGWDTEAEDWLLMEKALG